jgi:hypothetical protein
VEEHVEADDEKIGVKSLEDIRKQKSRTLWK